MIFPWFKCFPKIEPCSNFPTSHIYYAPVKNVSNPWSIAITIRGEIIPFFISSPLISLLTLKNPRHRSKMDPQWIEQPNRLSTFEPKRRRDESTFKIEFSTPLSVNSIILEISAVEKKFFFFHGRHNNNNNRKERRIDPFANRNYGEGLKRNSRGFFPSTLLVETAAASSFVSLPAFVSPFFLSLPLPRLRYHRALVSQSGHFVGRKKIVARPDTYSIRVTRN